MGVREWPWWRLLVRLTPMLNVNRTEDQLRSTTVRLNDSPTCITALFNSADFHCRRNSKR